MTTADMNEAMAIGAARYADIITTLNGAGLPTVFTQTGGMCAALEVTLEAGQHLLITDAEDSLSWDRDEQRGWARRVPQVAGAEEPADAHRGHRADRPFPRRRGLVDHRPNHLRQRRLHHAVVPGPSRHRLHTGYWATARGEKTSWS